MRFKLTRTNIGILLFSAIAISTFAFLSSAYTKEDIFGHRIKNYIFIQKYNWESDCRNETFAIDKVRENNAKTGANLTPVVDFLPKRLGDRKGSNRYKGATRSNLLCFTEFVLSTYETTFPLQKRFSAKNYRNDYVISNIVDKNGKLTIFDEIFNADYRVDIGPGGIYVSRNDRISSTEIVEVSILDLDFDGVADYGERISYLWNEKKRLFEEDKGMLRDLSPEELDERYSFIIIDMMVKHNLPIKRY